MKTIWIVGAVSFFIFSAARAGAATLPSELPDFARAEDNDPNRTAHCRITEILDPQLIRWRGDAGYLVQGNYYTVRRSITPLTENERRPGLLPTVNWIQIRFFRPVFENLSPYLSYEELLQNPNQGVFRQGSLVKTRLQPVQEYSDNKSYRGRHFYRIDTHQIADELDVIWWMNGVALAIESNPSSTGNRIFDIPSGRTLALAECQDRN